MLTPIDNEDIPSAFSTDNDLRKKIELMQNEKMYISKENIKLNEINKRLEDRLQELETDLSDSKRTVQKYLKDLLDTK